MGSENRCEIFHGKVAAIIIIGIIGLIVIA